MCGPEKQQEFLPGQCIVPLHAGLEVLILLLDLLVFLIQLHISIRLGTEEAKRQVNPSPLASMLVGRQQRSPRVSPLLLLLVEPFVFDIQDHFEALQLLLQIQGEVQLVPLGLVEGLLSLLQLLQVLLVLLLQLEQRLLQGDTQLLLLLLQALRRMLGANWKHKSRKLEPQLGKKVKGH
ncbi:hypothetical protein EYF80_042073 [Liparis tanakae]|uniref:Uncharacterized protein n=1 Tax=Liparis tanakae TaxID=230148 RepID=A0A4Z2G4P1_9TELE|nr:hypothetical protein EYF80_042073 [Liparis tanakae]